MRAIDEYTITDAVIEQMSGTPNPRLKQIMEILVKHLHAFAREADLTPDEWIQGIGFLTGVGQKCTEFRQEFILLSDTLGLSALVNSLNDKRGTDIDAVTKSSLLGPFYRKASPVMEAGATIVTKPTNGMETCLYGRVTDTKGNPIAHASVEVGSPTNTAITTCKRWIPRKWIYAAASTLTRKAATICAPFARSATKFLWMDLWEI